MKKRNLGIICAALAICGTAVFGTYAYLTTVSNIRTNSFMASTDGSKNITIELTEPEWDRIGSKDASDYTPGDEIAKDPMLTNTSKKQSVYSAIKVTYQLDNGQGVISNVKASELAAIAKIDAIDAGWELLTTYDDGSELYIFNTELAKDAITTKLFNNILINSALTSGQNTPFNIEVKGYAVQSRTNKGPIAMETIKSTLIDIAK